MDILGIFLLMGLFFIYHEILNIIHMNVIIKGVDTIKMNENKPPNDNNIHKILYENFNEDEVRILGNTFVVQIFYSLWALMGIIIGVAGGLSIGNFIGFILIIVLSLIPNSGKPKIIRYVDSILCIMTMMFMLGNYFFFV